VWLEKLSEGQVLCEAEIKMLKSRRVSPLATPFHISAPRFGSVTHHRCDTLERRADDHDKAIARSKELGMELQDAFAYVQKFSTTSQAPLPPPHETPSGQSAASLVFVLKECVAPSIFALWSIVNSAPAQVSRPHR
jgi:hypothetical protein